MKSNPLSLLIIINKLLDSAGFSLGAVAEYEMEERVKINKENKVREDEERKVREKTQVKGVLLKMLVNFGTELGPEIKGMLDMLMEGEVVVTDGIDNVELKNGIDGLLTLVGLGRSKTDEGEEGFGMPEGEAVQRVGEVLRFLGPVCEVADPKAEIESLRSQSTPSNLSSRGPSGPSRGPARGPVDDEEDDFAPNKNAKSLFTPDEIKMQAKIREHELENTRRASKGLPPLPPLNPDLEADPDGTHREEWMLNPGEHNFLDGLAAKEGVIKSRGFKNEKGANTAAAAPEPVVDPEVQAEMEALQRKHDELRGPSLMDVHRGKVQAAKEEKANEKGYGWSRKDLDAGRRVDKNNLKNLMGGKEALKDKFAGEMMKF